jgi:DNA-directed RNA polymerase specialized sigma24 family protein
MSLSIGEVKMTGFAQYLPAILDRPINVEKYSKTYENNRHHVYSLAFWMTDNELAAEALMTQTFCRAFAASPEPTADDIDRALIVELRDCMDLGTFTLNCAPCDRVLSVRRNTMRVDLERAVVQLPNTEKMIFLMHDVECYDHVQIARLLNISEEASVHGLHQARLRMRELLVK